MGQAIISRRGGSSGGTLFPVGPVTDFYAVAGNGEVILSWNNPANEYIGHQILVAEFGRVDLWCNEDHVPERPGDGYLVERDAQSPYTHDGVVNGVELFYQAFTYTTKGVVNPDAGPGVSATPRSKLLISDLPPGTLLDTGWMDLLLVHQGKPSEIYDDSFNDGTISRRTRGLMR